MVIKQIKQIIIYLLVYCFVGLLVYRFIGL